MYILCIFQMGKHLKCKIKYLHICTYNQNTNHHLWWHAFISLFDGQPVCRLSSLINRTLGCSIKQFVSNHNHLPSLFPARQSTDRLSLTIRASPCGDLLIVIHITISPSTISASISSKKREKKSLILTAC